MIRVLLFALLFTIPAAADDVFMNNTTSESNMCVIGITGQTASTPSAVAHANWSPITYNCAAGTYLPAGNDWTSDTQYDNGCATCPAGSYCIGGDYTYNETTAQGATSCNATYFGTTSAAGATSSAACYYANQSCPTISANTACDPHAATCTYTSQNTTGNFYHETGTYTGSCAMDFTCSTGYTKSTTQTAPTLPQTSQGGNSYEYHSHDNNTVSPNGSSMSAGSWSVTWGGVTNAGTMSGIASCNSIPAETDNYTYTNPSILPANTNMASTSTTGMYCWCKTTSWTPSDSSATTILSANWIFHYDYGNASNCLRNCAPDCAGGVRLNSAYRPAVFGTIGNAEQCIPATYSINYVLNGGSILPSGYTQLEYLEATGGQYIDTGLTVKQNSRAEFEYQFVGNDENFVFGQVGAPGTNVCSHCLGYRSDRIWWFTNSDFDFRDNEKHKVVFASDGNAYKDNVVIATRGEYVAYQDQTMLMFAERNDAASSYTIHKGKVKIYYLKFYEGDSVVRNFIPARRNSDNVLGMYDTVSGTFFTNDGTGTFVAGPDTDKYTYGVGATISAVPTRAHSSFVGWCTDAGLTNCAATQTIGMTATGDKTFYAKYLCDTGYSTNVSNTACNANTITVNWDNGAGGATQNTCTYGGDLTTPTTAPTKRGHVFTGWTFNLGN